jgi:Flp pilus assembly protein TadD
MALIASRDWDWKTAEEEDRKAIALNPGDPTAHLSYSNMLRYQGRVEESIAEAKRALELDPLAVLTNDVLGYAYVCAGRPDLTIAQSEAALELHPEDSGLHYLLGWAYVFQGVFDKGVEEIRKSHSMDGIDPDLSPDLAYIDAVTGKKAEARRILGRLLDLAKVAVVDPAQIAAVYAGLGQHEEALTLLEQAYEQRSPMVTWLKVDTRFDSLREEPRFKKVMRGAGLM